MNGMETFFQENIPTEKKDAFLVACCICVNVNAICLSLAHVSS